MNSCKQVLSFSIERIDNDTFLSLKITGTLTQEDYKIIAPMVNFALEGVKNPKIKVWVDGTQMKGLELSAAWNCFKLGLKHGSELERTAVYGNKNLQKISDKSYQGLFQEKSNISNVRMKL